MKLSSAISATLGALGRLAPLTALGLTFALATGCGGDDATCSTAADAICAAACTCGGSAGCSIGDAEGAITFESKADCLSLYALACSQPGGSVDYGACESALESPTCVPSTDGMALQLPPACDSE